MDRIRRRLRSFVWLALLEFAGLAVAPTVSRAIHLGAPPAELAGASMHAPMDAMAAPMAHHHHGHDHSSPPESAPKPTEHEHSLDRCAMCVVAAAAYALAAPPPKIDSHVAARDDVVARTHCAPRRHDLWSPASPRGPPAAA